MRLIDADKLRYKHAVKCNSNTTRPYTLYCISFDEVQHAPTIKAVSVDVLDKIRSELMLIEAMEEAIEIIDKYKAERSDK